MGATLSTVVGAHPLIDRPVTTPCGKGEGMCARDEREREHPLRVNGSSLPAESKAGGGSTHNKGCEEGGGAELKGRDPTGVPSLTPTHCP